MIWPQQIDSNLKAKKLLKTHNTSVVHIITIVFMIFNKRVKLKRAKNRFSIRNLNNGIYLFQYETKIMKKKKNFDNGMFWVTLSAIWSFHFVSSGHDFHRLIIRYFSISLNSAIMVLRRLLLPLMKKKATTLFFFFVNSTRS